MAYIRDRQKDASRARDGRGRVKGRRWQVKFQVDGRERDGGSYENKADAERRLTEIKAELLRGQWVDHTNQTTVIEYARSWAESQPGRPATRRRIESQIRTHLEGTPLGRRRLTAVRRSAVQAWATKLAETRAPSTVGLQVTLLAQVYAAAVLDGLVVSSPVVKIRVDQGDQPRVVPLTVAQVRDLAGAVPVRCRAMVLTQAGLGLRIGELLALRLQDVDFLGRTARVEHQLDVRTLERVAPKTPRSRRAVPLPTMVGEALAQHIEQWPPLADGSLFYAERGGLHRHAHYGTRVIKPAVTRLAAEEGSTFPADTTSHDLRHHYASVLLAAGESVVAVAERLGHKNASMVIKVYGHLLPDGEDRTRKAIDAAWSTPVEGVTAQGRPG